MTDTPSPDCTPVEPSEETLIDSLIPQGVDYLAGYLTEQLGHMDDDGASASERAQLLKLALDRFRAASVAPQMYEDIRQEVLAVCREKLASMMIRVGVATGHGDTFDDLLSELDASLPDLRAAGVAEERERCANIAHNNGKYSERFADGDIPDEIVFHNHACWSIRDAIRKGEAP